MGIISSKSPLERRNTVARRSQRRTLHNVKSKVENLHKNIRKFKGVSEDDQQYVALKNDTEYLKNDLTRRAKDLQPQVRNLYENIYKRISEANEALENKLHENKEKQENKKQFNKECENEQNKVQNENDDDDNADNIKLNKALTPPPSTPLLNEIVETDDHKRETVELKLVKMENQPPETAAAKEVRIISPAEKRKSILKVGIPVMPVAIQNEFTHRGETISNKITHIIKHLGQIEQEIHEFVGQKNGKQYNRFNDILNGYLTELNYMNPTDEEVLDQMRACRNYVGSCLSFLNEKATKIDNNNKAESFSSEDDDEEVFESNNNIALMDKVDHNLKLQKMLKNTPV